MAQLQLLSVLQVQFLDYHEHWEDKLGPLQASQAWLSAIHRVPNSCTCCCAVGMLPFKRRKQRDLLDALTAPPQQSSRLATRSGDMFDSGSSGDASGLQFRNASAGQAAISSLVPDGVIS